MANNLSAGAVDPRILSQLFVTVSATRARTSQPPPLMYAELLHYVMGRDTVDCRRIERGIGEHLPSRRLYRQLLADCRRAWLPREACAQDSDSALLNERQGSEFLLKFRSSKVDPQQIYVILELSSQQLAPPGSRLMLHISSDQGTWRLAFADVVDGRTQLLLDTDDPRLVALRHMDTELSLVCA